MNSYSAALVRCYRKSYAANPWRQRWSGFPAACPAVDYTEAGWDLWKRLTPHLDAVVESSDRYDRQNPALSLL